MFNSNIQKGGALLDDSRRLVEAWSDERGVEENLRRVVEDNLLGKPSKARAEDVVRRILRPRFVSPGPNVIAALKALLDRPKSFVEACYYEAARDDRLLAAFAEEPLFGWYESGRAAVTVDEAASWLETQAHRGTAPVWSDSVRVKVARGLLAALRDFGILEGGSIKRFPTPHVTPLGFAYAAFREHEQGRSSRGIVNGAVWRRWLLDGVRIVDLFVQAERLGVLRFSQAGSAVRIDWRVGTLEEVARAAA